SISFTRSGIRPAIPDYRNHTFRLLLEQRPYNQRHLHPDESPKQGNSTGLMHGATTTRETKNPKKEE
ncbi:MAG: hypothetical protein KAJ90_04915, partial [Desulfobacterales bacterium]|nr:hypothetical protein [Desulfobacterales bacterium]